jgi:hypothetical protein
MVDGFGRLIMDISGIHMIHGVTLPITMAGGIGILSMVGTGVAGIAGRRHGSIGSGMTTIMDGVR